MSKLNTNKQSRSWIEDVVDKGTGQTLEEILQGFNMYFLSYTGNISTTRNLIPRILRKRGLWITYVKYDNNVYTEWYDANEIDDNSWGNSSNWRIGNNSLVGDITISSNGNWVINGTETEFKAIGEKGNTPLIRVSDNKLQVSYDLGKTYINVTENPVYTKFRWSADSKNVGRVQASTDEGKTWNNLSNDFTNNLHISKYIGADESLPTSGIAEGTIYAKGPYYEDTDTLQEYPSYRLWVYAWKNNTLAWQDHGEFTSIAAGIVQEPGDSEITVMSQKAVTEKNAEQDEKLSELGSYVSNPEYARAYTDAEGRFLWGIKHDGSIEFAKGVPTPIKEYIAAVDKDNDEEVERINQLVIGLLADIKILTDTYHYISNPEWACAIVDSEERILMGIKSDGSYYIPNRDMYHIDSNHEYVKAVVDSDGRILFGIRKDGTCYLPKGISEEAKKGLIELTSRIAYFENVFSHVDNPEWVQVTIDSQGKVLEGIGTDGKKYFPKQEMLEKFQDVEGRTEITLDSAGTILSYRDSSGVKHEHKQHTEHASFGSIDLTQENASQIQEALNQIGFSVKGKTDWSDAESLKIPMPKFAIINITNIDSMPTSKFQDMKAILEVWDMNGNYFKKKAILNAQGSSSMSFIKKNFAGDFCNDDWIGDDTFNLQIGDWVPQDSFHFKAYYTDFFKGIAVTSYHIYDNILKSRGILTDRPWKLAEDVESINNRSTAGLTDNGEQYDNGARCFPDGFPTIVYLNGEFYGIFSWQLKKHRDNMHQTKDVAEHVHLDGCITYESLFMLNGNLDWDIINGTKPQSNTNKDGFEIRNPKDLYCMDGSEYDADFNRQELIDETSPYYDLSSDSSKVKKRKQTSAKVKKYLSEFSKALPSIHAAANIYESDKSEDNLAKVKELVNTYFDIDNLIDYLIFSDVVYNYDGFAKNWQWFTYDGVKWFVAAYDVDCTFGNRSDARYIISPVSNNHINMSDRNPVGFIIRYYKTELEERYKYLRDNGIIDANLFCTMAKDWMLSISIDNYEKEYEKWPDAPCNKSSVVNSEYWELVLDDNGKPVEGTYNYNQETSYVIGNEVYYGFNNSSAPSYLFRCVKETSGAPPIKAFYVKDSFFRLCKWTEERINNIDLLYNY